VVTRAQGSAKLLSKDEKENEIKFAMRYIDRAPNNQSPWNYMRGIIYPEKISSYELLVTYVNEKCQKFILCANAYAMMADISRELDDKSRAKECFQHLISVDAIRAKYWQHLSNKVNS